MMNINSEIWKLVKELNTQNVKFVICGSFACILQGVQKETNDLDIYLHPEQENTEKLLKAIKILELQPAVPYPVEELPRLILNSKWQIEYGAMMYRFSMPGASAGLHILLTYPVPFYDLYLRANIMHVNGLNIAVSSKEDLIHAKSMIFPPRDSDLADRSALESMTEGKQNLFA